MVRTDSFALILSLIGGVVLLFIVAPLAGLVLDTPLGNMFEVTRDEQVINSIWLTLGTSFAGTFVCAIFAIPLAYVLARKEFPGKRLIHGIIDLPIVIPHSAAGIAVLGFISRDSFFGQMASSIGLDFVGHPIGISMAMAFVSIPFLVNAARDGFSSIPIRLEQAAKNLGANSVRVFFTISLPLAWRYILSGFIMMFARGLSEFGAVVIVAYHPMITPVLIYERYTSFGLKYARPVAILFILVSLVFFIGLRLLVQNKKDGKNGNSLLKNMTK